MLFKLYIVALYLFVISITITYAAISRWLREHPGTMLAMESGPRKFRLTVSQISVSLACFKRDRRTTPSFKHKKVPQGFSYDWELSLSLQSLVHVRVHNALIFRLSASDSSWTAFLAPRRLEHNRAAAVARPRNRPLCAPYDSRLFRWI